MFKNNCEKEKRFTVDLGIGKYIFKASVSYILRIGTIFPPKGFSLLLFTSSEFRINEVLPVINYRNPTLVYALDHQILGVVHLLIV